MKWAKKDGLPQTKKLKTKEEIEEETGDDEKSKYRSLAARANYLALDRADIRFAASERCKAMNRPTKHNRRTMMRNTLYLLGALRVVTMCESHWQPAALDVYTDSDWTGDAQSRKSTSGGVIMHGKHTVRTWSKNQGQGLS